MMYYEFTAGGIIYKLRLDTRAIVKLEKELGKNPLLVFANKANGNNPTYEEMVKILHCSLGVYHPETNYEDTYSIFDAYIADGHIINEFVSVITEIYIISGLFKKPKN